MENIINQLEKIATDSNERAQRNIQNLIGRIRAFTRDGDIGKLTECLAEAERWGALGDKPVPGQQWRLKSDPNKVLAVKWVSHGIVGYSDAYWRERTYGTRRLDLFLKWFELVK